jgi:hypothetical protein
MRVCAISMSLSVQLLAFWEQIPKSLSDSTRVMKDNEHFNYRALWELIK